MLRRKLNDGTWATVAGNTEVSDSLTDTSINKALSAKQGKVLNETKQADILTTVAGTAGQALARDSTGNALTFVDVIADTTFETWTITFEDGSTATRKVVFKQ